MSLDYKKEFCQNCQSYQAGVRSYVQKMILILLSCLFVIPGIVYYFLAKPSRCCMCGLKYSDQPDEQIEQSNNNGSIKK